MVSKNSVNSAGNPMSQTYCGCSCDFPIGTTEYIHPVSKIKYKPFTYKKFIARGEEKLDEDGNGKIIDAIPTDAFFSNLSLKKPVIVITGTLEEEFKYVLQDENLYSDHLIIQGEFELYSF
jgi:hypothetical protein